MVFYAVKGYYFVLYVVEITEEVIQVQVYVFIWKAHFKYKRTSTIAVFEK